MLKFDNYRRLFYENDFICCNYRRFFPNGNNRKIPRNTSEICYTKILKRVQMDNRKS